jgi:hypothetical protein
MWEPKMTDSPEPVFERIALDNIEATAATQVRVKMDPALIEQYTEDFKNGADFPPLDVFREENSERNIMADGFHRQRAAINAEREDIGCNVHVGGMREALIFALGANNNHGLRRSNRDKRHAVEMALKDPEISQYQMQEIADICRVTRQTVRRIQNDLLTEDGDGSTGNNGTKSHDPSVSDPTDDDFRDTGAELSQQDVELTELKQACSLVKAFPYDGAGAATNLALSKDDVADLEYVSTWCANAVLMHRKLQDDSNGTE